MIDCQEIAFSTLMVDCWREPGLEGVQLPVQIILLAALVTWWFVKGSLLLGWGIIRGVFSVLVALFSPPSKRPKSRRKKAATPSESRQRTGMATRSNDYYLKEIFGAILWISLMYRFLCEDGATRCREIFSSHPLNGIIIHGDRLSIRK